MDDKYLLEALKDRYGHGTEDRLTQLFAASFNQSEAFRLLVGDFFGQKYLANARCSTQQFYLAGKARAILDIVLHDTEGRPLVLIENKVNIDIEKRQPQLYNRIEGLQDCRKRYCFINGYISEPAMAGWQVRYWRDFYQRLIATRGTDEITDNFLSILEDYSMAKPYRIAAGHLKALAKALNALRYKERPSFEYKSPGFETLGTLKNFLEDLFARASTKATLQKRAGKRFRPRMCVQYWWEEKKPEGYQRLLLGCEARLAKPRNGIHSLWCSRALLWI